MSDLKHENLIKIIDFGEDEYKKVRSDISRKVYYIILELA